MNRKYLAEAVARRLDTTPAKADQAVEAVLDAIVRALAAGESVRLTGFGTLTVVDAPEREARNPATGQPITVPARARVKFIAGANLAALVNGKELPAGSAVAKAPKGSKRAAR